MTKASVNCVRGIAERELLMKSAGFSPHSKITEIWEEQKDK